MLLHGLLHLRNEMKRADVIQSKCDVKASRKDGEIEWERRRVMGERNGVDSGDDKDGLRRRYREKYLDKLVWRLKKIVKQSCQILMIAAIGRNM